MSPKNSPPAENSETAPQQIPADADIPWPIVDLDGDDPIREIMDSNEFEGCTAFFTNVEAAQRGLIPPKAQGLLFCTARNQRPEHVVEIGTYQASTSEAICRALH